VLTLAVALLAALSSSGGALAATGTFSVISSPNKGTNNNQLLGAAATSAGNAWSVGDYQSAFCVCSQRTLGEHWNGTSWSIVPTPNPATGSTDYDVLEGAAATAANDVWAVGYDGNPSVANDKSLIEHWNGTAWSVVASPNPYNSQDLYGVAAISSTDAWAVGSYFSDSPYRYGALIEHWNGTGWSVIPNPATTTLYAVTATGSNDVWAVGYSQILHWNGSAWSVVASPQGNYYLRSVKAVSPTNAWAVGWNEVPSGEGYYYHTLTEHWDGSAWSVVPDASPYTISGLLNGVTALSGTSVWAGGTVNGLSFVEKWDGSEWTRVSSPNRGTSNNTFQAAAASAGDVWAVGEWFHATSPYQAQTLVEECAQCS
jgi:hypothetical protein